MHPPDPEGCERPEPTASAERLEIARFTDDERLAEGRAFYFFEPGAETGVAIPAPNDCLECHHEHAAFDGTFTQFYPPLRTLGLDRAEAAASDLEGDDGSATLDQSPQ